MLYANVCKRRKVAEVSLTVSEQRAARSALAKVQATILRQSMATSSSPIFTVNPYESHPSLTQIEADVLWEYAKLNQHIKDVRALEL